MYWNLRDDMYKFELSFMKLFYNVVIDKNVFFFKNLILMDYLVS